MEESPSPTSHRTYNPHYLKYREKILANAKAYQKKKQEMLREEKRRKIALEYLQEKIEFKL